MTRAASFTLVAAKIFACLPKRMVKGVVEIFCQIGKSLADEVLAQSIVSVATFGLTILNDLGDPFFDVVAVGLLGRFRESVNGDIQIADFAEEVGKQLQILSYLF